MRRGMREMAVQVMFAAFSFLLIRVSLSELQVTVSESPVKANVGDNLLLTCHLGVDQPPVDMSRLMIQWYHRGNLLAEYDNKLDIQDPKVHMSKEELQKGNASLLLSNIKANQAGSYRCYVYYAADTRMKEIVLEVADPTKVQEEEEDEQEICPKGSSPLVLNKVDEMISDFYKIHGKLRSLTRKVQKCLCSQ
uniref:V-set domain-containing T-cell activation inhibitor 1-like n=1 Tax=Geotrypetes seraphini TaxID=260995 RepID=A0A6P8REP7_GEOSA|nr:V-set domain-containing T-cell activation inhibitor 1-like [Geotrypetes seraphini]